MAGPYAQALAARGLITPPPLHAMKPAAIQYAVPKQPTQQQTPFTCSYCKINMLASIDGFCRRAKICINCFNNTQRKYEEATNFNIGFKGN